MSARRLAELKAWRGLARSLRIYHLDRRHIRGLTLLYAGLVKPGDLCFDIGAHVGDRTRVLAGLGCRVVSVEPQPLPMRALRLLFGRLRGVHLVEAAVSEAPGEIVLHVNAANPTVSSASADLVAAARTGEGWSGQIWDKTVTVPATTLDALIAEHGMPTFIKIDVEGLEDRVLKGLSQPVPVLSFEFTTLQRPIGLKALAETERLGYRSFDLSLGESHTMHFGEPVAVEIMRETIERLPEAANSGDVYCFAD